MQLFEAVAHHTESSFSFLRYVRWSLYPSIFGQARASAFGHLALAVTLFNREIIGHSAGPHKDAALISRAFATVRGDLRQIQWFHTDRGSEFKNLRIDELLKTFEIGRSLSMKGCPYDNAVAEATYKVMKTEFIHQTSFQSLRHLELELYDYVNWFNKHRIHGTLGYLTPVQYRQEALKKAV